MMFWTQHHNPKFNNKKRRQRRKQHVPGGAQFDCLDRGHYLKVSGAAPCHQP